MVFESKESASQEIVQGVLGSVLWRGGEPQRRLSCSADNWFRKYWGPSTIFCEYLQEGIKRGTP